MPGPLKRLKSRHLYFELEEKISHVLGLHFMPERNAWCQLDKMGDIEDIVKIIELSDLPNREFEIIITFRRDALGEFTGAGNYALCRMFDFTRYRREFFSGWPNKNPPIEFGNKKSIFGRLVIEGVGSYSRGVQVENISISKENIINRTWGRQSEEEAKRYATFITQDWKNNRITEISCNPSCLASYFEKSDLPFQTSPVFFRPEVLLKYKSDRDKYQLKDRSISCRGSWYLQTYDVNEAGQVHTYISYLGNLPYEEQLHWKQFNELPKAPISKRAFETDFEGKWHNEYDPLNSLKNKLRKLHQENVGWWKLRNEDSLTKVLYPYTSSPDEWADEIFKSRPISYRGF